jgi:phosphoribosyl-dephospho-CoA transferase
MPPDPAPRVHALLRMTTPAALVWEGPPPQWAPPALRRAPWVVMRRAAPRSGLWPVGVRGALRNQRGAGWLPECAVADCVTPQRLAAQRGWREHPRIALNPAFSSLDAVEAIFAAHGLAGRWGPGGSVGFELASGLPATGAQSDLDLILQADRPIARADAARLHADLSSLAPRVDLLLETPHGAVCLSEYVLGRGAMMLRSALGPQLVNDPWEIDWAHVSSA